MTELALVGQLSFDDARALTDEVKRDAEALWRKLVRLYEGAAHLALGYSSWGAYFEVEFGQSPTRGKQLLRAGRVLDTLGEGTIVPPTNEAQARELVPLLDEPEQLREAWAETQERSSAEARPVTAGLVREVVEEKRPHTVTILGSSESEEWYTPAEYVEAVRAVLGTIDLDPASCEAANDVVKAGRFYTENDDGLAHTWTGRVFLNPPYGSKCPRFVSKLQEDYDNGHVSEAVLLVSAYSTETRWFQPLFDYPICFATPRVKFWTPGREVVAPTFGAAFVYFGPDETKFLARFAPFGAVVKRAA